MLPKGIKRTTLHIHIPQDCTAKCPVELQARKEISLYILSSSWVHKYHANLHADLDIVYSSYTSSL